MRAAAITPAVRAALQRSAEADVDDSLLDWLASRRAATPCTVELVSVDRLRDWSLTPDRGRIAHDGGRLFSIVGMEVERVRGSVCERVSQPLIDQPAHGLLGLAICVVDGCVEVLVQAKREPGDLEGAQLAPTIQGAAPDGVILFDASLPERADLFLARRDRNVIVLVDRPASLAPDVRWATLAELGRALARPDTVSTSLRSLLACLAALSLEANEAVQTREWLAECDIRWSWRASPRPLDRLFGWRLLETGLLPIFPNAFGGLQVVYADVHAPPREVPRWTQPMLARTQLGVHELHVHREAGRARVLLEATLGPGQADGVRLGLAQLPAPAGRVCFDVPLADDGGYLLGIRNRHRVIEHEQAFEPPEHARWIGQNELPTLLAAGMLDSAARTCVAALLLGSGLE